jgi:membrane protein implicated in regulation of membrane protease activity
VGALYLAALVVGVGIVGLQFLMPGSGGHGAPGGDVHAGGGHEAAHDHPASGVMMVVLSLRFWTYALLGFGLVGSSLRFLSLGGAATPVAATIVGVLGGLIASVTFGTLSRTAVSSSADPSELVGQLGRVLLDVAPGRHGKIRLKLRGQTIDLLALADNDTLAEGAQVLVVGLRDSVALVRPAPPELLDKTE